MVMSLDGVVVDRNGRSGALSTQPDRLLFNQLRRDCDVVLVGAGTVRSERYQQAPWPVAVVSHTVNLPVDLPLLDPSGGPVIVLTSELGAERAPSWVQQRCDVVACGSDHVDLNQAMNWLDAAGLRRVHCEGGTTLLSALVEKDLVDQLLVTVSPQFLGGGGAIHLVDLPYVLDPVRTGRFEHVVTSDETIFLKVTMHR